VIESQPYSATDARRYLTRLAPPLATLLLAAVTGLAHADDADTHTQIALGAGIERMPEWIGANSHRNQAVPYVDIEIPGVGELSTADGLNLDLIDGDKLHGGFYGNYLWGRTRDGLGPRLGGIVNSLGPRVQAGGYLEYHPNKQFSYGANLSHDTAGAGAYLNLYADYQLPNLGYIEHEFELQWQGMNGAAMNRFFGLNAAQAAALGTPTWRPGAGSQQISLEYDAFIPTSQHTGFALALGYTRLLGQAADSPLVSRFGQRNQFSQTLAFVYHF
jgi:outer membrane scaffolding protein for murein synthesis (MipA/OmpV family)